MKMRETRIRLDEIGSSSSGEKLTKETAYLPEDIIEHILLRLPAKSVWRFRMVCKLWRSIISCTSFARKHLNFVSRFPSLYLAYSEDKISVYGKGLQADNLWTPIHAESLELNGLVGSCNGLVCIEGKQKLTVFNPITSQYISLPKSSTGKSLKELSTWDFGFNPNTNEYKILHFYYYNDDMKPNNTASRLEVLTLGQDRSFWRQIEGGASLYPYYRAINVGATMYWKIHNLSFIHFFDLSEEKFRQIRAPKGWGTGSNSLIKDLNGRLCWGSVDGPPKVINLWTLDEPEKKSWTLLHTIEFRNLPYVSLDNFSFSTHEGCPRHWQRPGAEIRGNKIVLSHLCHVREDNNTSLISP